MTDQELAELAARDPRAAEIEALKIVFRCSQERAETMWERAHEMKNRDAPRVARGGDWENIGEYYLTTTFWIDLPSNENPDMGFRCFRSHRVPRPQLASGRNTAIIPHGPRPQLEPMSKRTESRNPVHPSGKRFQATNITARGNVMVHELSNARGNRKDDIVLYDGYDGSTLWVEADRVGSTPEEAVRVALARARKKIASIKRLLRVLEADRDALANVLNPARVAKIVLKSSRGRAKP